VPAPALSCEDTRVGEPIRKAASVIAVRRSIDGPEVLVVERGTESRFLPGYVAFPGGASDGDDAGRAQRWFGDTAEAARACAVRELLEEVGLVLTADGLRPADASGLAAVDAAPPRTLQLPRIARWIAPEDVPTRFDAQFFAVRAPDGLVPLPDDAEVADAWWISPRALLDAWREGTRKLYWPTWYTVNALAGCETVDALLSLEIRTREPDDDELARLPRSVFWQD
jgi:8-oxo-dGTP pyrophosphatase MutT (NUDIX family)